MSSQQIADLVNSRHDKVKQSIERLVARGVIAQPPMGDGAKSGNGVVSREYLVCKRDSFVVVAQLSPEFTAALVDRWQELENGKPSALPKSFADALRLAADQQEQIEQQAQQLAIAAPKVEFVDKYVEATGLKGFRQVAKLLGAKENALSEFLESQKIMYRLGGERVPYANHIDAGRFSVKTGQADNGHAFNSAKFTPKGVQWLAELWNKSGESK
ncbi:MAG: phage antirepressor KilAC domain-containing protein [Pseudomonas sp.]|nr:phage antirepressor KilAC domain-containing protein [Pseudomonas sp.]